MDSISIYPNGFIYNREKLPNISISHLAQSRRGSICGFSSSSRRRMRSYLLTNHVPGFQLVGITLTLPWNDDTWTIDEFSSVLHRFRIAWLRRFPSSGCVFRVELQVRRVPHLHLVAWHSPCDLPSLRDDYTFLWSRSFSDYHGGSLSGFLRYGIKVDTDLNYTGTVRYLCDHASKSKQAQLGYPGKQWGIWGRINFSPLPSRLVDLDDSSLVILSRYVRKLSRFRVSADCVFGSRLSKSAKLRRVNYLQPSTIDRILGFCNHCIAPQSVTRPQKKAVSEA